MKDKDSKYSVERAQAIFIRNVLLLLFGPFVAAFALEHFAPLPFISAYEIVWLIVSLGFFDHEFPIGLITLGLVLALVCWCSQVLIIRTYNGWMRCALKYYQTLGIYKDAREELQTLKKLVEFVPSYTFIVSFIPGLIDIYALSFAAALVLEEEIEAALVILVIGFTCSFSLRGQYDNLPPWLVKLDNAKEERQNRIDRDTATHYIALAQTRRETADRPHLTQPRSIRQKRPW